MLRPQLALPFPGELIIDNFAGGGGTSTGLEAAFGRPVDIAINHDPEALAMHAINHPYTKHLCESVWDVDPIEVTGNQPVGLVWLSPDCKHFSKAKGGTPVSKEIRGLAWVTMRWAALCRPRVIMLENVEEFQTWGPVIVGEDGKLYPDPKRKGKTFDSFIRQLRQHGYKVDWREMRACDNGAPTIRKRLFLVARRDGLPIIWPEQTHGEPTSREVLAGALAPYRTAAECIDFSLPAESIFDRKKPLAVNTQRRVAKGLYRHVLASAKPFIVTNTTGHAGAATDEPLPTVTTGNHHMLGAPVLAPFMAGAGGPAYSGKPVAANQPFGTLTTENHRAIVAPALVPFLTEHANASNQRTMPADAPLRTVCAQVKGGHFSVVAPTLAPLRGTSDAHMGGHSIEQPLSTISAGGTHHAMVGAHLVTIGYGEREGQQPRVHDIEAPLGTVVAGGVKQALVAAHLAQLTHHGERAGTTPAEPLPTVTGAHRGEQALIVANLVDMGHGESCSTGAKRWSNGIRSLETPLNSVTASSVPSALASAFFEQANGGFYDGSGRAAEAPMSTITSSGSNQQLVTAYLVKYYSSGGQWQKADEPMHTLPTKGRMGLVQSVQVPADCLSPEHRAKARRCAELLHEHLPEHFPEPADLVLMSYDGIWWVLVDITLRMLKARELYRAQAFPDSYIIHEIPDPLLLFKEGVQVADPLAIPRVPLTVTAQVRMCGNSVSPAQAEALVRANFRHEAAFMGQVA
ncbi:DNA cytosine methyltransferase [Pandoraea apista]|uniref:DNA cytosine methyltransferase n=1 Tax=Pandoraea apista TaxID=93218 RepID=UPI001EE513FF|nr:DNA cytosine methyltransferase [Pandoraea apista]